VKSMTRREALLALPLVAASSRVFGQPKKGQLPVKALSHVTLSVSDPKRSIEFYQGLFGLPSQSYQGPTDASPPSLRIGAGPQFLFVSGIRGGGKPGIDHFCMTTPNFTVDRVTGILAEHCVTKVDGAGAGIAGGPMKYRIRIRDERTGGSKEGTPEMYIGDPDGIAVQLQDTTYCGGSGPMGEVCFAKPVAPPKAGLIAIKDLSHVSLSVSDVGRSQAFYQELFAMPLQARQRAVPLLGIGSNRQFLRLAPAGADQAPRISGCCFTMENFDSDAVEKTLTSFGLKSRVPSNRLSGPLEYYFQVRLPPEGGAGTSELYFTDPDGILMQIQDVRYCGGAGRLGEVCTG
jgi:catechol 2,3-dioxygenase-like lactoylglutathione lyase family enzyme